jgi:hypothetical protein
LALVIVVMTVNFRCVVLYLKLLGWQGRCPENAVGGVLSAAQKQGITLRETDKK